MHLDAAVARLCRDLFNIQDNSSTYSRTQAQERFMGVNIIVCSNFTSGVSLGYKESHSCFIFMATNCIFYDCQRTPSRNQACLDTTASQLFILTAALAGKAKEEWSRFSNLGFSVPSLGKKQGARVVSIYIIEPIRFQKESQLQAGHLLYNQCRQ